MKKILFSIFSIILGLFVILIWEIGSHGNSLRFRPWKIEDWILSLLILASFSVPVIFFINWLRKKIKSNRNIE
jgi:hypothetical protein